MIASLVLPCYNPAPGWVQVVHASYLSFCAAARGTVELIIVLDGRSDQVTDVSLAFLRQHIVGLEVVEYTVNRGKGYAIRQGVARATGDIIIYTDIDFPYAQHSMLDIYNALVHDECDVAIGVKNNAYYAHVPFLRRIISRYLRFFIRLLLSMPVTDTQCGLKGFRRTVAPVFLATTIDRYLFDLEFVRNCYKHKQYRVKAVEVALNENVHFRKMNFSILLPELFNFIKLLFQ